MNQKYVSLQIGDGDVDVGAAVVPDAVLPVAVMATLQGTVSNVTLGPGFQNRVTLNDHLLDVGADRILDRVASSHHRNRTIIPE